MRFPARDPDGHDPCKDVRVHYVEAGPCVPWVVRGVNEGEERVLPCIHRAPVNLVSHVNFGRQQEEYHAAEGCHHDHHLNRQNHLDASAIVLGGQDQCRRVEGVQQGIG